MLVCDAMQNLDAGETRGERLMIVCNKSQRTIEFQRRDIDVSVRQRLEAIKGQRGGTGVNM